MPLTLPETLILNRTDRLGDAVITTAMAGVIKRASPQTKVIVIARAYTRTVWEHCAHIDELITLEDLDEHGDSEAVERIRAVGAGAIVHAYPLRRVVEWAKKAKVPTRIASNRVLGHWLTCNVLVDITRKRSTLHEAQLGIQLLSPFGVPIPQPYSALLDYMGLTIPSPSPTIVQRLARGKRNIILHPLSEGGLRWGLQNFESLIGLLNPERNHIFLTGSTAEAALYRQHLSTGASHVTDLGGQLSVAELWELIAASDALVACSTGPLHLASVAGTRAIGLYGNFRAINPARWAPIGLDAHALVSDPDCPTCAMGHCECIKEIPAQRVADLLDSGCESTWKSDP